MRCFVLLVLAGLTVGLNINGPHWNVRLLGARIRSPQMAYILVNQGTGNEELGKDQKIDKLQEQVDSLTQKVKTLENELRKINDEVQATKKELQATKNELQATKNELQATKAEIAAEFRATKNELQATKAEFRARLMKVEKLLGLSQKETYF
jgi:septal ring factor EnvC (AmiA/AmiB activator)